MDLHSHARHVLANYINEANSQIGTLPDGVAHADWVADRFLAWWSERVAEALADAAGAIEGISAELHRLGGWSNPELGDAMHELTHAGDALSALHALLGVNEHE